MVEDGWIEQEMDTNWIVERQRSTQLPNGKDFLHVGYPPAIDASKRS